MGQGRRIGLILKIPVLTYHATNISGNDYGTNDHVALESDLELFYKHGIQIISTIDLLNWIKGNLKLDLSKKYVVLTFDDGSELDVIDWIHPVYGFQKSFLTILQNQYNSTNQYIHATSFVIASSATRKVLEKTCLGGYKMWGDKWWSKTEIKEVISIENHSWDHVHPTLEKVCQKDNIKGNFAKIECFEDADLQISDATKYIENTMQNKSIGLFAYPYGHYNQYLTEEYFPKQQNKIKAAFTCEPEPVTKNTNVWKIPRYVCGADWKSIEELKRIII